MKAYCFNSWQTTTSIVMYSWESYFDFIEAVRQDIYSFFSVMYEAFLCRCMYISWHNDSKLVLWGRIRPEKIALTPTNMKLDALCSLLKFLYLLPYNRPRLDLLVWVLDWKLMQYFRVSNIQGGLVYESPFGGRSLWNFWKYLWENIIMAYITQIIRIFLYLPRMDAQPILHM